MSIVWPTENKKAMDAFYGDPDGGHGGANPKWEAANVVELVPPYEMRFSWGPKVEKLRFHKRCRDAFGEALLEVKKLYGAQKDIEALHLHLTGGSFIYRLMRGSATQKSTHAWAAALDIDPQHNPFKRKWRKNAGFVPLEFAACFKKQGLFWRGDNGDIDPMHFQAVTR